ncbi:MAG: ATP-binding protein [Deltaproteobacteria bacterium]|nr:ATP-binding protein [Deltaproteobacteria bacterium]
MKTLEITANDQRVLVHAPFGRDGSIVSSTLEGANIKATLFASVAQLLDELRNGVGAIIVTQESLTPGNLRLMETAVESQPPWSDVPILVFLGRGESDEARAMRISRMLGNVTVLERPVSRFTMVSATKAALRARRRQCEVRELLYHRENEILQRDQFLAMLGHELRNPLAAISQAVDLMRVSQAEPLPRPLQVMRRQCDHLVRLVDELLDVSRVTTGKISLSRKDIDVREILTSALGPLEPLFAKQRLGLRVDLGSQRLTVNGDATRLEQVFTNLLTNAIKYTPAGGHVRVTASVEGDAVVIKVADTGLGLSPKVISRVFDIFVQSERSLDRSQGGLGIGLTVVRRLVELHGGTIAVSSDGEGKGSEFTVRLPLLLSRAAQSATVEMAAIQDASLHVLVVEDNEDNREGLKDLLEAFGHRVDVAADGEQGLRLATRLRPDVAMVDIGLPHLNGYQVAERVRLALGDSIHLVALTGYGQPDDIRRTAAAGFDAHVTKPASLDKLLAALRPHERHA